MLGSKSFFPKREEDELGADVANSSPAKVTLLQLNAA
jgi:hypothetical protein